MLNDAAVDLAVRAALALGCDVHERSVFARKNYFYPDLPKGYQISQYDKPLASGGQLHIGVQENGSPIAIGITRLHMEEDAGKSLHDRFPGVTAIDLNRAGVPLVEIVSEPDMRSSREAGAYLRTLKQILEYMDVSDVSMEEGSLRVDANVSARRRGDTSLGQKTEVKNMNSFSSWSSPASARCWPRVGRWSSKRCCGMLPCSRCGRRARRKAVTTIAISRNRTFHRW